QVQQYRAEPSNIFFHNQQQFRVELPKVAPCHPDLVNHVLVGISDGHLKLLSAKLQEEHPDCIEVIRKLIATTESMIDQFHSDAHQEMEQYLNKQGIQECFDLIFSKNPHLHSNYENMLLGRYSSLKEIPQGYAAKIQYNSYFPAIVTLVKGCTFPVEELKESCEEYCRQQQPIQHFQNNVIPLIHFLQRIKNILLWPKEFEFSEGEYNFLQANFYSLIAIANKTMTNTSLIPYEYIRISEEEKKNAEAILRKKKTPLAKQRQALRVLLHARIPWSALQAIGSLCHTSGGVSEGDKAQNLALLRAALKDLVHDLPIVQYTIEELITFEVTGNIVLPKTLPDNCYANIHLLGNFTEMKRNLVKMKQTLGHWINLPMTTEAFATPRIKYAVLRTVQIVGEMSKNLRDAGILRDDPTWDCVEELRNLLSHSERLSVYKRLACLIDESSVRQFINLFEDFRNLREFFHEINIACNQAGTWEEKKRMQSESKEHRRDIVLLGLQDLFFFLTEKISHDLQTSLRRTLGTEGATLARSEIKDIVEALSHGHFDSYESQVEKLPLSKNNKHELRKAIKVQVSKTAAANDAKDAKPGLLKKTIGIVKQLQSGKNTASAKSELDELLRILHAKIAETRPLLKVIRVKLAGSKSLTQLDVVENHVTLLLENVEEYVARKKQEGQILLATVPIYDDVAQAGEDLIRSMQLAPMAEESVMLAIISLGIINPRDQELWKTAHKAGVKKTEYHQEKKIGADLFEDARKKALRSADVVLDRIQKLDTLLRGCDLHNGLFEKDKLLLLGCQYLMSDFRINANTLNSCIETIRHHIPAGRQFYQAIQQELVSSIEIGNHILHVHEVTEPGSLTPTGHAFFLSQHIMRLLHNFSLGKHSDISKDSLYKKLLQLKRYLNTR
nr:hypothetical protein [Chlamydiota bacterium]